MWRLLLLPMVPIYAGVLGTKNWLWDRQILPQRWLRHAVISVGSVSAGGAGKTPVVMLLAELLERGGYEVRILTRGHGRNGISILKVDPEGGAAEFGDEPLLMARRLKGSSVWVGIDRHRAGKMSELGETAGDKVVYLLDDGFQHRKLARDVDIVLVTRQDVEDRLLPAGNLREPLKGVRRANVVVVREDEAEVAGVAGGTPVWVIRRRLAFPEGIRLPLRPVAFCGIARPENFLSMLATDRVVPIAVSIFGDHHPYSVDDIEKLMDVARSNDADGFLTTEKDAVKLSAAMIERLGGVGRVVVAELRVELTDELASMKALLSLIER